jgi:hypothetical protein
VQCVWLYGSWRCGGGGAYFRVFAIIFLIKMNGQILCGKVNMHKYFDTESVLWLVGLTRLMCSYLCVDPDTSSLTTVVGVKSGDPSIALGNRISVN